MSRRSTRLGSKVEATGAVSHSVEPPSTKPAAKKRKVVSESKTILDRAKGEQDGLRATTATSASKDDGKSKPKRGSLKMMVEMPVDIVMEVFQHLDPVDLLSLARTDRTLRAYILKRSIALPLWKVAFARVEPKPPACPDDLSLPQYANLLYGRTCFTERDFQLRQITSPVANDFYSSTLTYVREQFEKNQEALDQLRLKGSKEDLDAFIKGKTAKVNQRGVLARGRFHSWDVLQENAKKLEVNRRREQRKRAVVDKLKELGYTSELDKLGSWTTANLPGVKGIRPLTEKEWERIKPGLLAILDEKRRAAEHKKRCNVISRRTYLLSGILQHFITHNRQWDLPDISEALLAKLEPFRTLVYDTPADKELKAKEFMKYLDEVPKALKAWRKDAEGVLLSLIPPASTGKSGSKQGKARQKSKGEAAVSDTSFLNLATTIFYCKWCGKDKPLTHPFVLQHECLFDRHAPDQAHDYAASSNQKQREQDRQVIYLKEEDRSDPNPLWNEGGDQLFFFEEASTFASAVITALGEDPKTVTWQELDKANQRLECLRCRKPKASASKRLVMDWRQAVLHELDSETQHRKLRFNREMSANLKLTYREAWQKLDAQSLKKAYAKESCNGEIVTRCPDAKLYCFECGMVSLKDDGTVASRGHESFTSVKPGDVKCTKGHLLAKHGTFTCSDPHSWCDNESFSGEPKPVKIP